MSIGINTSCLLEAHVLGKVARQLVFAPCGQAQFSDIPTVHPQSLGAELAHLDKEALLKQSPLAELLLDIHKTLAPPGKPHP